ncbi:MAG: DUF4418 family protein [Firmicutes bacterium]|nr:DUF4418 family protein [Bacillota bacterium]
MKTSKVTPTDIILPILSALLALGAVFLFHACPAKEDGSFMSCHWAQETVFGLGCVMTVISGLHAGADSRRMKTGISLSMIPVEIYTALVPGCVVKLCAMKNMRCHTAMRPAVVIISILLLITSAVDIYIGSKREGGKNEADI